ncbi:phage tail protein [Escherichia coli]|nr:tail fiber assembly protein [Escherichia coli]KHH25504.1 phage tail protein [Escherichia coli]
MTVIFDKKGLASEPGTIRCFYYDPITKEYVGWSDEYINIGVSMPDNSTASDPGDEIDGKVSVFRNIGWEQEEDYRSEVVYSTDDGSPSVVDYIGEIKAGFTTAVPTTPYDKWNGSHWVTDTDAQHAADVETADAEKQLKLDQANEFMNSKQWPGKAAMGRLKDAEKKQYNAWLDYLDALEAVDTTSAPDIEWPTPPEV